MAGRKSRKNTTGQRTLDLIGTSGCWTGPLGTLNSICGMEPFHLQAHKRRSAFLKLSSKARLGVFEG